MTYNPDWGTGGGGITELTGDVTAAGTGSVAATVAADAVTNAKLADMAANTLKGNNTGGSANPVDLTASQVKTLLAIAAADVSGLGTAATANTSAFDAAGTASAAISSHVAAPDPHPQYALESSLGTLATQNGTFSGTSSGTNTGDQTITLTGDVTGSGTGSFAATVANDAVTYAKMQNVSAASRLLGRGDSGAGDVQEITVGSGLAMTGTTLSATGGGSGGDASLLFGAITTTSTTSNTVWSAVTGSEVTVVAGRTYAIRWRLRTYSAAATTGLRLRRALAGGAVGTVFGWHALVMNAALAINGKSSREGTVDTTANASLGNATSTTTDAGTHWVDCLFQCTTGGTIGLELQSEVNTSSCTVDGDGSYWEAVWRTT